MNKQYEIVEGIAVSTGISWTCYTSSPIKFRLKVDLTDESGKVTKRTGETVWFCVKVSSGCQRCYSERLALRWGQLPFTVENLAKVEPFVDDKEIHKLLNMKLKGPFPEPHKRCAVFLQDMSDLFADFVPFEMIDRIMAVAALRPDITFQFLTKRMARMVEYFTEWSTVAGRLGCAPTEWPLQNVLLGFSAENQEYFDSRWADMRKLAAMGWKVFASIEPQIGPVDARAALYQRCTNDIHGTICDSLAPPGLSWAIIGGESGHGARPFNVQWMRDSIAQFKAAGVPLWCKQLGAHAIDNDLAWARCGHCGWVGRNSELPRDPEHLCGADTCPECKGSNAICCCYQSEEAAEAGGEAGNGNTRMKLKDSHGADWREWASDLLVRQLCDTEADETEDFGDPATHGASGKCLHISVTGGICSICGETGL